MKSYGGADIAKAVPPPDKLAKSKPAEPDDDDMGGSSDKDEDDAAELSAMDAFDKATTPEDRLAAFKDLVAICGKTY